MNGTIAASVLVACAALVACAGDDARSAAEPAIAAPAPPAASAPMASAALPIGGSLAGAGGLWRVRVSTCGQLLAASQRDREAALMFYYGRLAERSRTQSIDIGKLDVDLHRAIDQCARTPTLPAAAAFQQQGQGPSTAPRWFWDAL